MLIVRKLLTYFKAFVHRHLRTVMVEGYMFLRINYFCRLRRSGEYQCSKLNIKGCAQKLGQPLIFYYSRLKLSISSPPFREGVGVGSLFFHQLLFAYVFSHLALLIYKHHEGDARKLEFLLQIAPLGAGDVDVLTLNIVGLKE